MRAEQHPKEVANIIQHTSNSDNLYTFNVGLCDGFLHVNVFQEEWKGSFLREAQSCSISQIGLFNRAISPSFFPMMSEIVRTHPVSSIYFVFDRVGSNKLLFDDGQLQHFVVELIKNDQLKMITIDQVYPYFSHCFFKGLLRSTYEVSLLRLQVNALAGRSMNKKSLKVIASCKVIDKLVLTKGFYLSDMILSGILEEGPLNRKLTYADIIVDTNVNGLFKLYGNRTKFQLTIFDRTPMRRRLCQTKQIISHSEKHRILVTLTASMDEKRGVVKRINRFKLGLNRKLKIL